MNKIKGKRAYLYLLLMVIIGIALLIHIVLQTKAITAGDTLPQVSFRSHTGLQNIKQNNKALIIVYFRISCAHCRNQIAVFDRYISDFKSLAIYFLTGESDFFSNHNGKLWENLAHADNVIFGIVSKKDFETLFGISAIPSLYFFDSHGKLAQKISGETTADKIKQIIYNLKSGRAQSGNN